MGFLDQITSIIGNKKLNQYKNILLWIESQGGIHRLINLFEQQGFGEIIQSWIGIGENKSITLDQINSIFGSKNISILANKVGLNIEQTSLLISEYLPILVNTATLDGNIPNKLNIISIGLKLLRNKFNGKVKVR